MKMAPALVRLYEQMPEPKYVIAMGACTITGGMFSADSPTAVRGVDKLIPVDIYLPGCPPRPEALMDALVKLRKKIANESMQERGLLNQTHRYYSTTHSMKVVSPILTGAYLQTGTHDQSPCGNRRSDGNARHAQHSRPLKNRRSNVAEEEIKVTAEITPHRSPTRTGG